MKIECKLQFKYATSKDATRIADSIKIDDENFVETTIKRNRLISNIKSNSISSLLHTLEDYLSCVNVAENILKRKD